MKGSGVERAGVGDPVRVPPCVPSRPRALSGPRAPLLRVQPGQGTRRGRLQSRPLRVPCGQRGGGTACLQPARPGGVEPAWAEARRAESRKIAPEEDIDGQQDHGVHVADAPPERLLRDAGQFLLQGGLLGGTQRLLRGPREPAKPAPEPLSPGPAWG